MRQPRHGGGWQAIRYTLSKARASGGLWAMWKAMRSRNTCKTCALGMGGQRGGMTNEAGQFPELCKKSIQAMAADMQPGIPLDYFQQHGLNELEGLSSRELEHLGRLRQPMVIDEGEQHYHPIEWEEAFTHIVASLRASDPDETFFYSSGRSSNEAAFLTQIFARLYGTNNVNNCSYYCHQASGVGLTATVGSGTATVQLEDVEHCDLLFIIGANPSSNHPRFMRLCMNLKRRGGSVVVVNPLKEVGLERFKVPSDAFSMLKATEIADHYAQPRIGGDWAMLTGIAKAVLEKHAEDRDFVRNFCDDYDAFRASVENTSWQQIFTESGLDEAEIRELARRYCGSRKTIFAWAMGITHHLHGSDTVKMIANLAMLRGMVGREHCGLLPLRGHSNIQGIGTMGVVPQLKGPYKAQAEAALGVRFPEEPGLDTLACMERAHAGKVRFAWNLGGNLYDANPDTGFAREAFAAIDTVVYLNTTLNRSHIFGRGKRTIVLPVLARDEEPESSTQESMFSYIRLSDGGQRRHLGPKSESEITAAIAGQVLGSDGPVDWSQMHRHDAVRALISEVVPGMDAMRAIGSTKQEFFIPNRHPLQGRFPTESGRAKFHAVVLPERPLDGEVLELMTIRSEGQFNAVVYEEYDKYRGQERRDVILLNREDMQRLGLQHDDPVEVRSATGSMTGVLVRAYDIAKGCAAMYYPEANVLVSREVDSQSRTPSFKAVAVTVAPATAAV